MVLVRYFNEDKPVEKNNLKVSRHLPYIMKQILYDSRILDKHYMLCPLYPEGDFQIGVTGRLEKRLNSQESKESPKLGMDRELKEEIGIKVYNFRDIKPSVVHLGGEKHSYGYIVNINDCTYTTGGEIKIGVHTGNIKKVGCIVFGNKSQINSYMNAPVIPYTDSDGIIGVVAVSVGDIRKHIPVF